MAKIGRPPSYTPEEIEQHKQLYLSLLALGKNEREMDAIEGFPGHNYRSEWKNDPAFKEQCQRARATGASAHLQEAKEKLAYAWERAVEDSASPQLVSLAESFMRHARWIAAKHNREEFGDVVKNIQEGGDKPVAVEHSGQVAIGLVADQISRILGK